MTNPYQLEPCHRYFKIAYRAMASPCEILLRHCDQKTANKLAKLATNETARIEEKYSRYLKQNLVDQLNQSNGKKVAIDQETKQLLDYAKHLYQLSDGLFDITSGILRKAWQFTADAKLPTKAQVEKLLPFIGFNKIHYNHQYFSMPKGMQIDWGGIVKEYAVDRVAQLIATVSEQRKIDFLVNFGGDLRAVNMTGENKCWQVGIEQKPKASKDPKKTIQLSEGAVATSGTLKRFFVAQGKSYSHILNPKTGYPIEGLPQSITAFAPSCVLAGSYTSLAMLKASDAESFLKEQGIKSICIW